MDKIPEDVMRAAAECWASLPKEGAGIAHIARAILAERRRCADVAEERAEWVPLKAGDMRKAIEAGQ